MNILQLKNKHKNKAVLLLGAGPSLREASPSELSQLAEGKVTISIKQAFSYFPTQYHVINDNNLVNYNWDSQTIILASHSTNVNVPFLHVIADHCFYIEQNINYQNSISNDLDFGNNTIEKRPLIRKLGPGILWSIVLFFCHHIGVSRIYSLGIDLAPQGQKTREHFYGDAVLNKAHSLGEAEANNEIALSGYFYKWLQSQGIEWFKLSEKDNYLHEDIPQWTPDDIMIKNAMHDN